MDMDMDMYVRCIQCISRRHAGALAYTIPY